MHPTTVPDDALADLTRRYARFSLSAGGLASALGGALALVAYFVGALTPPDSLWGRIGLATTPLVWIGAKEWLRRRYYQRLGRVTQVRTDSERRWHVGFTLAIGLITLAVAGFVLAGIVDGSRSVKDDPGVIGYLAFVLSTPVLVWYFMRTPLELIVGVFLMAQAALAVVGVHYSLGEQPQAPIAALVLLVIGIRQHAEFRKLRRDIQRLRAG
jgi:hypothetical protein